MYEDNQSNGHNWETTKGGAIILARGTTSRPNADSYKIA